MAGRCNRRRRRRRLRANLGSVHSESSPPQSPGSAAQCKIPPPNRQQQITEEKPDRRRTTRDARAVRPFLLGLIRGYYIDAISRLPAAELRTTLARGLLVGGHCYGPLHPVHNIILNSVWYAAAFPFRADDPIDVDVISNQGISRLAHRSVDGLVAYLCHQCPDLSRDDALWHLALSHAALHGAARGAVPIGRSGLQAVPLQVAAEAARHPKPSALTHFVTTVLPPLERDALSLLAGRRRLSSHDILRLSAMLQPLPLPDALAQPPCSQELSIRIGQIIAERRRFLRIAYQMFTDIADAALRKFARQTGARYRLHTIYGQSIVEAGDWCGLDQYFHINFMAWPIGEQTQNQIPVCFFAEAHNPGTRDCSEEAITSCCMLGCAQTTPNHADNCYACARIKRKVDHPNGEEHFGGHPHNTDEIEDDRDCPTTIDVDYRFFDPDRDIDLVKWYADKINHDEAVERSLNSSTDDEKVAEEDIEAIARGLKSSTNDEIVAEEDIEVYKTPVPNQQQHVAEEKPDLPRTTRDARAVRPFLLGLIRGYYIDAISRLPAAELRTTLARGLLVGGHCYGPFHPVHNIILNSVWYAAAFPFRGDPIDADVLTTEGISRLAHRSLDGSVAYLCHQCPDLSRDDALWHLALSLAAPSSARGAAPFGCTKLESVPFQVAAQAARHPKPSALTSFVFSALPPVVRDVLSLLAGRRRLSLDDIPRLSAMLQPFPLPDALAQQPCSQELSIRIGKIIAERRRCWKILYQMYIDIAAAALQKFARQTSERYRLHTIYGQSIVEAGDWYGQDRYFHINFMACPKGKQTQNQIPVCFFAEAHNPANRNCSEEDITSCCMLGCAQPSPSHVDNCYGCARIKRKIDHPNGEEHFGGHPHKTDETEDDRDWGATIDVDYRFFDPDRDIDLVKYYADKINRAEAIYSKLGLKNSSTSDEDEDVAKEDMEVYCRRYV